MKIVIVGSSGFIGTALARYFEKTEELVLLTRKPKGEFDHYWNPEKGLLEASQLENADLIINLAGESILGRWSEKKKEAIRESLYLSTQLLCQTIMTLKNPPKLYIGASAVGYYGDRGLEIVTEAGGVGEGFLSEVCSYWEKIPQALSKMGIRVVLARFGIVLGDGGALKYIEKAFQTGMGGVLGSGDQIMSWIAIDDLCRAVTHVIDHSALTGPVNFTAPESVTNRTFTQTVGKLLNKPTLLSLPKFAISMLLGEGSEMFLSSIQAKPEKLLESGFIFKYPDLESALKEYLKHQ